MYFRSFVRLIKRYLNYLIREITNREVVDLRSNIVVLCCGDTTVVQFWMIIIDYFLITHDSGSKIALKKLLVYKTHLKMLVFEIIKRETISNSAILTFREVNYTLCADRSCYYK